MTTNAPKFILTILAALAIPALGCAASHRPATVPMAPLDLGAAVAAPAPAPLVRDHFKRDGSGSISEEALRHVLSAPVYLVEHARVGVIQVATGYEPDADLPLTTVPSELSKALEDAGLFEIATEVSTDWPADRGISGLRELAARYRSEYLLLYRHRFVDATRTNSWGWAYPLLVAIPFAPAQTLETTGVLEATLFDVRTGTILFTSFERTSGESDETPFGHDRKRKALKTELLKKAASRLADQVVAKARRLAASRPPRPAAPIPSGAATATGSS
jgi:hypothetical protein